MALLIMCHYDWNDGTLIILKLSSRGSRVLGCYNIRKWLIEGNLDLVIVQPLQISYNADATLFHIRGSSTIIVSLEYLLDELDERRAVLDM